MKKIMTFLCLLSLFSNAYAAETSGAYPEPTPGLSKIGGVSQGNTPVKTGRCLQARL